jgi:HAAS
MEPRDLADVVLVPAAARIVDGYLSELESRLRAGRRVRKEIVLEIADGLTCAVEEHMQRGQPADAAARTAVAELGEPRTLAAAFAGQLGSAAAHRLGAGLVVTGPLVGLTWVAAYATAGLNWSSQIVNVLSAMPQYPLILAVTVPAAMIAITGSGRAATHLVVPARVVTAAAIVAVIGCVAGDLSLLSAAVFGRNLIASGPAGLVAVAMAASVVRLSAVTWAGRRIARLRAGVN